MIGLKKKLAPLFHPIRNKKKPIVTHLHAFSLALRQVHAITSSSDWFIVLPVSFVIGKSDYFGFDWFTVLPVPFVIG